MSSYLLGFQDVDSTKLMVVGSKGANLGELSRIEGIRVPDGFCISTEAFKRTIREMSSLNELLDRLSLLKVEDRGEVRELSAEIRRAIEGIAIPQEIREEITRFLSGLGEKSAYAVRSSATAEDLPGASFAGQQDTFLWVRGIDEVLAHVRRCISSLFTGRAIAYRIDMGFDHRQVGISVGIQKMANSFAAGVMFTLNPSNGDRSSIVVDSNFGFGESVVSGEVTPDQFRINKVSLEVLNRTISDKEICYTVDPKTQVSIKTEVPEERRKVQSVTDKELVELAKMGKLIEQHYGCPMDIEWAVDKDMPEGGNIFILQARPETVWSNKAAEVVSTAKGSSAMDHILSSMMAGKKVK